MKILIVIVCTCLALSGCQLTRIEGVVDNVKIKVSTKDSHDSKGSFCPPGQAKKGNC